LHLAGKARGSQNCDFARQFFCTLDKLDVRFQNAIREGAKAARPNQTCQMILSASSKALPLTKPGSAKCAGQTPVIFDFVTFPHPNRHNSGSS
jgi:hypothetical protein